MAAIPALRLFEDFKDEIQNPNSVISVFNFSFSQENEGTINLPNLTSPTEQEFNDINKSNIYSGETFRSNNIIDLTLNIPDFEDFENKNYKYLYLLYSDLLTGQSDLIGGVVDMELLIQNGIIGFDNEKNFLKIPLPNFDCDFRLISNEIIDHLENNNFSRYEANVSTASGTRFINKKSGITLLNQDKYNDETYIDSMNIDRLGLL